MTQLVQANRAEIIPVLSGRLVSSMIVSFSCNPPLCRYDGICTVSPPETNYKCVIKTCVMLYRISLEMYLRST